MTPPNIVQQLAWLKYQIDHMQRGLPIGMSKGKVSPDRAVQMLDCAQASYRTLEGLLKLTRGEVLSD